MPLWRRVRLRRGVRLRERGRRGNRLAAHTRDHKPGGTGNAAGRCRGPFRDNAEASELPRGRQPQSVGFAELLDVDLLVLEPQVHTVLDVDADARAPHHVRATTVDEL